MSYVLYDTGNNVFFSRIVRAFFQVFVGYIEKWYNEGKFKQTGSKRVDENGIKAFFEQHSQIFTPLNCALFGRAIPCKNINCKENYKAALASDQMARAFEYITGVITDFHQNLSDGWKRYDYQRIFQHYNIGKMKNVIEEIPISSENDPIGYKNSHPEEYKCSYIKGTNKLKAKDREFVYVRAKTNSDYADFTAQTELPGVTPCDALQAI